MTIRNTAKEANEKPGHVLAAAMVLGPSGAIEAQEAQGQAELVASSELPAEVLGGAPEQLEAMGIKLGPVPSEDPLFRPATLPEGWKLEPTDHSMWSKLKDDKGRARASIFYKAAFYDRKAHIQIDRRFSTEVDYEAQDKSGLAVCIAKDCGVPVHRVERPIANKDQSWIDTDAVRVECREWLDEHYPDWQDPTKYWD